MIHLKDINKTYNNGQPLHVLKGINLDIEQGEFVSIMGRRARASPRCSTFWAFSTTTTRANTPCRHADKGSVGDARRRIPQPHDRLHLPVVQPHCLQDCR